VVNAWERLFNRDRRCYRRDRPHYAAVRVHDAVVALTPSGRRRAVLPLLAACLLGACSGGSDKAAPTPTPGTTSVAPSPATTTSGPTPTRTAATPTRSAAVPAGGGRLSSWHGCGGGFQCATLTVPLDPAKPRLGTIGIAVTRHKATGSHRIGSLFANPGGPGGSAIDWLQGWAYSSFPSEIRKRFDIVAFDPRGVGHTAPVRCLSTSGLDDYIHLDPTPDSAAERDALVTANQALDAGCQNRSARLLPYVDTVTVARDLDRLRQALGESKLTYVGYSYGTAIGATYLDLFPTRVRAMVLDGALDPAMTWDGFVRGQAGGFEQAFGAFLADCEKNDCAFRDAVSGDLGDAFDQLAAQVDARPLTGRGSRNVGPGEFIAGPARGLYSKHLWPRLGAALAAADHGDGAGLLELSDDYFERSDRGYSNLQEANIAVNCVDRPWPHTAKPYFDLAAQLAKTSPRFGQMIALAGLSCVAWPTPATGRPHPVKAPGSPAVVVIGGTRDPATPYAWSQNLASQLSRGVLLTHVGDGHTVYRVGAPNCILRPVDDYLLTLRVPLPSRC
jgi:pimeloyl-ACP methyl ester carboxylesterase